MDTGTSFPLRDRNGRTTSSSS